MIPAKRGKLGADQTDGGQIADTEIDEAPTKEEILEGIRDGFVYVMSGGKGQPIDDAHREIAEELAREEQAQDADIRL
ncbi:MAG: hypothetical protein OXI30_15530 [Chloroflexota bacterium]|nr:hypothetical protein [Chloroflexota bacterium]